MTISTTGTPTNTIHGTSDAVRRSVRWYKGNTASDSPNKYRNMVIEGYMTTQIFKAAINFIFAFIETCI